MNLVYFTAGLSLLDEELRAQCLRLPEVLAEIRRLQSRHPETDLLSTVPFPEEFNAYSRSFQLKICEAIQEGLAERVFRRGQSFDGVLKRSEFSGPAAVAKDIRWRLSGSEKVRVEVIGPGFDEVPGLIRDDRVVFVDSIAVDSALSWFWDEFKKAASS